MKLGGHKWWKISEGTLKVKVLENNNLDVLFIHKLLTWSHHLYRLQGLLRINSSFLLLWFFKKIANVSVSLAESVVRFQQKGTLPEYSFNFFLFVSAIQMSLYHEHTKWTKETPANLINYVQFISPHEHFSR